MVGAKVFSQLVLEVELCSKLVEMYLYLTVKTFVLEKQVGAYARIISKIKV